MEQKDNQNLKISKTKEIVALLDRLPPCLQLKDLSFDKDFSKELVFSLAVVGAMKSGKSTLINALIGEEILPTRSFPMTIFPIIVEHNPAQMLPLIVMEEDTLLAFNWAVTKIRVILKVLGYGSKEYSFPTEIPTCDLGDDEVISLIREISRVFGSFISECHKFTETTTAAFPGEFLPEYVISKINSNKDSSIRIHVGDISNEKIKHSAVGSKLLSTNFFKKVTYFDHYRYVFEDEKDSTTNMEIKGLLAAWKACLRGWKKIVYEQTLEKIVLDYILDGSIDNMLIFDKPLSPEECRKRLDALVGITRLGINLGLENPACSFVNKWPKVIIKFTDFAKDQKFRIIDTPGPDEAMRSELAGAISSVLVKANSLICVIDSSYFNMYGEHMTNQLIKSASALRGNRFFVACNKFDQYNSSEESLKDHVVGSFDIGRENIFLVSARSALLGNIFSRLTEGKEEKPVIDFKVKGENNPLLYWAEKMFGYAVKGGYLESSLDELKSYNKKYFKDESNVFVMKECILANLVPEAQRFVVEDILRKVHEHTALCYTIITKTPLKFTEFDKHKETIKENLSAFIIDLNETVLERLRSLFLVERSSQIFVNLENYKVLGLSEKNLGDLLYKFDNEEALVAKLQEFATQILLTIQNEYFTFARGLVPKLENSEGIAIMNYIFLSNPFTDAGVLISNTKKITKRIWWTLYLVKKDNSTILLKDAGALFGSNITSLMKVFEEGVYVEIERLRVRRQSELEWRATEFLDKTNGVDLNRCQEQLDSILANLLTLGYAI